MIMCGARLPFNITCEELSSATTESWLSSESVHYRRCRLLQIHRVRTSLFEIIADNVRILHLVGSQIQLVKQQSPLLMLNATVWQVQSDSCRNRCVLKQI